MARFEGACHKDKKIPTFGASALGAYVRHGETLEGAGSSPVAEVQACSTEGASVYISMLRLLFNRGAHRVVSAVNVYKLTGSGGPPIA